jgi:hypothetical protein
MAFKALPIVGEQVNRTYTITGAITDNDIGKPVKISGTDNVALCSATDTIYGFINSVEVGTTGGKIVVGVVVSGRVRVILTGVVAIGAVVEAAANTAAGVVKAGAWGLIQTHTPAATDQKKWILISGAGTAGTEGVIESL